MASQAGHVLRMGLFLVLGLFGSWFVVTFLIGLTRKGSGQRYRANGIRWLPSMPEAAIGFVTVFFDTFGIGSFATTTAAFRAWRLVPDELIPGTLNVGHTVTSVLGAFIFIQLVPVSASTLLPMIAAAGVGAWLGAGIVARLPRHQVRLGMGAALAIASGIMLLSQLNLLPSGADASGLSGWRLIASVGGNLIFGGLMTLGIGLYAPCMILVSLLGMNPRGAFPIMMGSCAFLLSISGTRFVRAERYHSSAAVGLTLGGIPGLLIAAFVVKSLPLGAVRWIVLIVVLYTALTLLEAGRRERARMLGSNAMDLQHTP